MDTPGSNANPSALSDVPNKSQEEGNQSSQSNDEDTVPPEQPPQPLDDGQMAAGADQDREYGCKYCRKKFTNKQALGGHQNAHKVERALEKNARDTQGTCLGYFGGTSPAPFLSTYHRNHSFLNRSLLSWSYPSPQNGISIGYNSRPGLPIAGDPYAPRPVPGFNNVYSGWSPSLRRIPHQFPGQPPNMPNQGVNFRFSNIEEGSSSFRPVSDQGLSPFAGPRIRPDHMNLGIGNNNQLNIPGNEEIDDSGLDLSLKL